MSNEALIATVNAGEYQLLYIDGELKYHREEVSPEKIAEYSDGDISDISTEWRIGDVSVVDPPETYEDLCELTDV
jgi:hypothetical protein